MKLKFILLYLVSLALIFVVVTAFWKNTTPQPSAENETNDDAAHFMQIDTLLHGKLAGFENSIASYRKDKNSSDLTAAQRHAFSLQEAIDSIERQASILLDGPRKQFMQIAVGHFKAMMTERSALLYGDAIIPAATTQTASNNAANPNAASAEIERLQLALAQKDERIQVLEKLGSSSGEDKDKLIASLQNQLREKDAALQQKARQPVTAAGSTDGEWKQKYAALKASFDKTAASEKALKAAYKTVAEDNRRLLNQLQTLRTEKKN